MGWRWVVWLVLAAAACSRQQPSSTSTPAASPAASEAPATPAPPPASPVASSTSAPVAPAQTAERPVLPPPENGKANVALAGCLAAQEKPSAPTRAMPAPDSVNLSATGLGVVLRHALSHNCCAEVTVDSELRQSDVRIVERFGGKVCRCMCNSVIRAAVRLAPGRYHVTVAQVDSAGTEKVVHEEDVAVSSLRH